MKLLNQKRVGTGESMTNIKVSFSIDRWRRLLRGKRQCQISKKKVMNCSRQVNEKVKAKGSQLLCKR